MSTFDLNVDTGHVDIRLNVCRHHVELDREKAQCRQCIIKNFALDGNKHKVLAPAGGRRPRDLVLL